MARVSSSRPSCAWGLFRRYELWLPSLRGFLMALCLLVGALGFTVRNQCTFLSPNDRVGGDLLVMEGWVPDHVVRAAIDEFHRGGYRQLLVTGGGIERGERLSEWKTYAQLGQASLIRMGFPPEKTLAVVGSQVDRDRTFNCALQLREWFLKQGTFPPVVQVISTGPHCRRTRLMFEVGLGPQTRVGIISVADPAYPERRWWINSTGFRDVIAETIAYIYARFIFHATPVGDLAGEIAPSGVPSRLK